MIKKVILVIFYILAWVADMLLAGWLVLDRIYYRAFRGTLSVLFGEENIVVQWQIRAADRFIAVILGIGWLVFMIVLEESFRKAMSDGTLLRKFIRVTAVLLLIILAADLVMAYVQGFQLPWSVWLVMALELIFGVGGLWFTRRKKVVQPVNLD